MLGGLVEQTTGLVLMLAKLRNKRRDDTARRPDVGGETGSRVPVTSHVERDIMLRSRIHGMLPARMRRPRFRPTSASPRPSLLQVYQISFLSARHLTPRMGLLATMWLQAIPIACNCVARIQVV